MGFSWIGFLSVWIRLESVARGGIRLELVVVVVWRSLVMGCGFWVLGFGGSCNGGFWSMCGVVDCVDTIFHLALIHASKKKKIKKIEKGAKS